MSTMRPITDFPVAERRKIRFVLTDIDDTLTNRDGLTSLAYQAMERLRDEGYIVVPVTGRPAGWCDHIARMWPVDAVVGENGAFYFRYDHYDRRMITRYWRDEAQRAEDRARLAELREEILAAVPGAGIASDQPYRTADLAIDFNEDVPHLSNEDIAKIVAMFEAAGAKAKVSSIHVNGWFGEYDKLSMTRVLLTEQFATDMDISNSAVLFAGDSPNDAPMFAYFDNSVGVANVRRFDGELDAEPAWVTENTCGAGFAEIADALIDARYNP